MSDRRRSSPLEKATLANIVLMTVVFDNSHNFEVELSEFLEFVKFSLLPKFRELKIQRIRTK